MKTSLKIFRLNELCLARTDDNWNRGMCIELAGDGNPCILFIDDGSMLPIPIENIRKMPQQFAYRCVTVDCIIDGKCTDWKIVLAFRIILFLIFQVSKILFPPKKLSI